MSIEVARKNIRLEPCDRWAHTEYSLNYSSDYCQKRAVGGGEDCLQIDFAFGTNDGIVNWAERGRVTDMGHAAYAVDGSDQRASAKSPFKSPEEVWEFDAVKEYGLPDEQEQVDAYEKLVRDNKANSPEQLVTGGYYKSIVSGAIAAFGWDMLLMGASDPGKMAKVFDSFFSYTQFFMKCWAKTSVEVCIQHDDFVWTEGAFMHPDIYRRDIIPRYAELWKPLREAGKKLLFCSDGNWTEFAPDIAEAGADGFIFEPCVDFGYMAENFGQTHCLVGSYVDCRDLTFEKWDKVKADIDNTFRALAKCKGAIITVGNHLPPNIPHHMLDKYFDNMLPKLRKK